MKIGIIMLAGWKQPPFRLYKLLYEIQGKPMFCYILDTLYDVQKNWEQLPGETESCLEVSVVTQYDFVAEQAENMDLEFIITRLLKGNFFLGKNGLEMQIRRQMQLCFVWQHSLAFRRTIGGLIPCRIRGEKGLSVFLTELIWAIPVFSGKNILESLDC